MRFHRFFALPLCTVLLAAVPQAHASSGKVFSGAINNHYSIRMTLTRRGANVTGPYVYTKVGEPIALRGEVHEDDIVVSFEVKENGENSLVLRGTFENESRFVGTWSEPDGSHEIPFQVEARSATSADTAAGSVIITEKRVVLRHGIKGEEGYKEAPVRFPLIRGAGAVTAKIQGAVSLKAVFNQSLKELEAEFRKSSWLDEIFYKMNYNKNFILDLTFYMSGTGAYPSTSATHVIVNLKTGDSLRAADVFDESSLKAVAAMADGRMQDKIKKTISEWAKQGEDVEDLFEGKQFTERNLDSFSISDRGVTFLYDFGFPHVIKAAEPAPGEYLFFSFEQLKPHIRRGGLLAVFLK